MIKKVHKLLGLLRHRDYRAALFTSGVAAAIEHERLLQTLDCATIIDIGANGGQFALVARHCFPSAHVFSFEPLSAPQSRFRSALSHDPMISLAPVAIGSESGYSIIYVAAKDDSSSLLPMTSLQTSLFTESREVRTETVRVERLEERIRHDDIRPPALLKIDVQGYELSTLRGCEPFFALLAHLYVECSFVELYEGQALADEIIAYLRDNGFRLEGVYNTYFDSHGRAVQSDLLFTRDTPRP